ELQAVKLLVTDRARARKAIRPAGVDHEPPVQTGCVVEHDLAFGERDRAATEQQGRALPLAQARAHHARESLRGDERVRLVQPAFELRKRDLVTVPAPHYELAHALFERGLEISGV